MDPRIPISRRDWLKAAAALALGPPARALSGASQRQPAATSRNPKRADSRVAAAPEVTFVDVAAQAGIAFRHDNAATPEKYLIETMGSGCGWIDFDQDGLLDLYLVNGAATRL